MKTALQAAAAAVLLFAASAPSGAATVLQNAPDIGLNVMTNGMGSSSYFPDACTNFTVEAWIKPTDFQTSTGVYSPIFSNTTSDRAGYSRHIFGLRQRKLSLFCATVTSGDRFPVSEADIPAGTWTHVAATRSATEVRYYVNGALDSVHTGSYLPPVGEYANSHLTIGGYLSVQNFYPRTGWSDAARVFQGSIAEVRVWTRERTAEEIAADHTRRLRGDEEGLLLYVPMDGDASGSCVVDRVSGQRLVVPHTMRLAEDDTLPVAPAAARRTGEGFLRSIRAGHAAVETDLRLENRGASGPDFTMEAWLRVSSQKPNDQWIVSQVAETGDTGWIGLDIRGGTLRPEIAISCRRHYVDTDIPLDEWVHVAAVRSGSSVAIYTNGAPAGITSSTCLATPLSAANAAAPITLFNALPRQNQSFGGDLREIRVWNVARTARQIAEWYDKAATGREEGLVGRWALDETCGSKIRYSVSGAESELPECMGLVSGTSVRNPSHYNQVATDVRLATTDFTLEAWVKDLSPASREGGNGRGYIMSQWISGNTTSWISLCFNGRESLKPGVRIGSSNFFESKTAIAKGKWFHLAATRDGNAVTVYLDREIVATGEFTGTAAPPAANIAFFQIGGHSGHVGEIRDARAWSVARTQEQIRKTMFGGIVGTEEGLVGWWPCDDGPSSSCIMNRKTNNVGALLPALATWERESAPLLDVPESEAETAAEFGGGHFSVARTGTAVDAGDFTFETWVLPRSWSFNQSFLFAQYKQNESNPNRFICGFNDTGRFGLFIGGADSAGRAGGWKETADPVPLNRWTHLAATREGSTLRLYVDGALSAEFENYSTLSPWSAEYPHPLTLGGVDGDYVESGSTRRNNISRSLHGAMREARVWSVARTQAQIADNMGRKVHASEAGLVGYWPLDGEDGASALLNHASGHETGYALVGWDRVPPLALKDAPGPLVMVVR